VHFCLAFFVNEPKACFKVKLNKKSYSPHRGMALIIMKRPLPGSRILLDA
jgi:hypothetical protein